jgi:hypothetical protein
MSSALLPTNATPWEGALADVMPPSQVVVSAIGAMRRVKHVSPRASMLPYLVWEYGLGELTPYVPNLYDLIDQGVRWQRLRGTVSAVAIGLAWIGYSAIVEEQWTGRSWWNSFQLRFPALPAQDYPDLERIEGITQLSVPKRSQLRRGVHQYDVCAFELDHAAMDAAILDAESGIAVTEAGTIWSFGRRHEFAHTLTQAEGAALGNWLEPVDDSPLLWKDMDLQWIEANFKWADDPVAQRASIMATWFLSRTGYLRLSGDHGIIGYRRCRALNTVQAHLDGAYRFGDQRLRPKAGSGLLYVEAMTQFDDADALTCTEVALVFDGEPAVGVAPGRQWLTHNQYLGGTPIAVRPVSIPLRRTVREQFKFLMRF